MRCRCFLQVLGCGLGVRVMRRGYEFKAGKDKILRLLRKRWKERMVACMNRSYRLGSGYVVCEKKDG
jgi:hypothetical protein